MKPRIFRGKKLERNEEDYINKASAAGRRVLLFSEMESIKWYIGDKIAGELDFRGIVIPNPNYEGTTIKLDKAGLKIRNALVGFAGVYTDPHWFGADDPSDAKESWDWFFKELNMTKEELILLEWYFIVQHIWLGYNLPQAFRIMSLAVDLHNLKLEGISVAAKITEIRSKVKGSFRAFRRFEKKDKLESLLRMDTLINYLSDASAEARLARFANSLGRNVTLEIHPDLVIDGVKVEVKYDRKEMKLKENSLAMM